MTVVAIQGWKGSYSHEATVVAFGPAGTIQPHADFHSVLAALTDGRADRALVPVENTIVGGIASTTELIARSAVEEVDEVILAVHHCLVAPGGVSIDDVRRVASHPVALAQCGRFLAARGAWRLVEVADTAGGVRDMVGGELDVESVVASHLAADLYGCEVLATDIQDVADNFTRFLVLSRQE